MELGWSHLSPTYARFGDKLFAPPPQKAPFAAALVGHGSLAGRHLDSGLPTTGRGSLLTWLVCLSVFAAGPLLF